MELQAVNKRNVDDISTGLITCKYCVFVSVKVWPNAYWLTNRMSCGHNHTEVIIKKFT